MTLYGCGEIGVAIIMAQRLLLLLWSVTVMKFCLASAPTDFTLLHQHGYRAAASADIKV